ncbi:hypothetical protein POM88_002410 [Heracleum sosnowskyi]|uniref:Uncharacterized protein n=1 Tax=Heracleum sosnowskyi TaxID=360622 RepID=A0AAD8JIE3_9APIA|nr:hypothetical protein POM88_002410 [Heracleum sosnowskyi]
MLKRKHTSLRCGNYEQYGHNSRTCKNPKLERNIEVELGYEVEGGQPVNVKKPSKCNYCQEGGHNSRTCNTKKVDEMFKKKETLAKSKEDEVSKKKEPKTQAKTGTHGGITRPFKPPAKVGPLGIQIEDFDGNHNKEFTSLRNLEDARMKRQKNIEKPN